MNRVILILGGVSALSTLSSCIVGYVYFADGTPAAGTEVTFKACDDCPEYSAVTDSLGSFSYDPYSNPALPAFVDPDDGVIVTVKGREWSEVEGPSIRCFRTGDVQLTHRTIYSTYVQPDGTEVQYTVVPDIYTERFSMLTDPAVPCETLDLTLSLQQIFADPDNDGLTVSVEALYGADFQDADTDDDGLNDALEVYGTFAEGTPASRTWRAGSDIRSRGATPDRKDVFVEVDYWEGTSGTMRPGADLQSMIDAHYAGLDDIGNPDLSTGIDVVFVMDEEDSSLNACGNLTQEERTEYRTPRREGMFTFGLFCCCGTGGAAPIPGSQFFVRGRTDFNENNDMTEEAQNTLFSSIIHEFGHALGLRHGGFEGRNCKPNYPSDMNYAYFPAFALDGDHYSLATTRSQYSSGSLPQIEEETVSEFDPLNAPYGTVSFLEVFGGLTERRYQTFLSSNGNTDVDWDRSGAPNPGTPDVPVRTGGAGGCTDTTFRTIRDSNDAETIEESLDDPERLAQPGSGSSGGSSGAGGTEMRCGSVGSRDVAVARAYPRPWMRADALQRLKETTGLAEDRLESWAREAGFDTANRHDIVRLETLLEASARGRSAQHLISTMDYGRSTQWLSQEAAEKEIVERGRRLLQEALGKPVDVSFADCPMQSADARDVGDGTPQSAILRHSIDGSFNTIQLCR